MRTHDPFQALRLTGYRWLFVAHVLMVGADRMQATALSWWLYERTSSAAVLGISGLLQFLPILLLAIPVGHLIDVKPRRTMLQVGQGILLVTSLVLFWCVRSTAPIGVLLPLISLIGFGNVFSSIARPTMLRDTLPATAAENAGSWNTIGRRVASVIAPVIAGVLIAHAGGAGAVFLINAGLLILSFFAVSRVASPSFGNSSAMDTKSVLEGMRFIRRSPLILSTTLLDMFAMFLGGATGLLPIFARDILHVGSIGLGFLTAASSLGSGVAAVVMASRGRLKHAGNSLLFSIAGFGVMTIVFGLSQWMLLSFIALFFAGALDAINVLVRTTILQLYVPERLRGRVFGVNMIFVYSSNELGDFESGMVASIIGAAPSVVLGGIGSIVLAGLFARIWPELLRLKELREPTAAFADAEDEMASA